MPCLNIQFLHVMILRWLRQFLPGTCRSEDITDLERHLDNGLDNATPLPFGQDDARHPIPAPGQVQCADPQSEPTNERSYSLFPRKFFYHRFSDEAK
ncbi:hypothetical protein EYZ11_008368 [Aspergillus tanneri]|uniref:Uncharacterized protein n=1 Tax=Aspergillus tanneri TaxID=1220188 RepID=A0A4S3JAK5_9EURO|nr:hypothetical protein EYZ11_008368 [Aspergillus tanneri]